jgi:hypothetical protein
MNIAELGLANTSAEARGTGATTKPGDFKLVSHNIFMSHIHDKPRCRGGR